MNALIAFSYQDAPLRVETDTDGEPLFHAGDLCAILGYANPWDAIRRHVDEGDLVKREALTAGGPQQANWVREPGMWSLVLGSETAAAKPVKRWVVAEVLPSIRKTGVYALPTSDTAKLAREVKRLKADVAALKRSPAKPKPDLAERVEKWLVRWRPFACSPDWIAREMLYKHTITNAERQAIKAGMRRAGYSR